MRTLTIKSLYHCIHFRSCALLLVLGSIVYGNHLQNPFQFDTVAYIINQHRLDNINEQLTTNYLIKDFFHRSLLQISIALNAHLDGYRTYGYHLINLLLHLINSLLIYFITSRAWFYLKGINCKSNETEKRFIALFAAVLFLLHPIQTESVVYIMSRSEVFAGTFYLSSFLLFQVYLTKNRPISLGLKCIVFIVLSIFFLLGFSVKQTLITLPLMLLLYFLFGESPESKIIHWLNKRKWRIGFILLVGIIFLLQKLLTDELFLIGASAAGDHIGRLNYMLSQPSVIFYYYLRVLLFPINLNIDPDILLATEWWSWKLITALIGIIGLIYISLRAKENRFLLYFVCWFIIVLSPSSSIITLNDLAAEHRTYLASYSIYAVIGLILYRVPYLVFSNYPQKCRNITLMLSIFMFIIFSVLTIQRNKIWASEVSLWADTLKKSPQKVRPLINLAQAYTKVGSFDVAIDHYEKALAINPNVFAANYNLGTLYLERGRQKEALQLLTTAALIKPKIPETHGLLGEIYLKLKQIELAKFHLKQAVEINPDYAFAMRNLGIIYYFHLQQPKEAAVYFERALSIDPIQKEADKIRILINKIKKSKTERGYIK
jgi:protein O-mannosyl-transferase